MMLTVDEHKEKTAEILRTMTAQGMAAELAILRNKMENIEESKKISERMFKKINPQ